MNCPCQVKLERNRRQDAAGDWDSAWDTAIFMRHANAAPLPPLTIDRVDGSGTINADSVLTRSLPKRLHP